MSYRDFWANERDFGSNSAVSYEGLCVDLVASLHVPMHSLGRREELQYFFHSVGGKRIAFDTTRSINYDSSRRRFRVPSSNKMKVGASSLLLFPI